MSSSKVGRSTVLVSPALRDLFERIARLPAFQDVLAAVRKGEPAEAHVVGPNLTAQSILCVLLNRYVERPVIAVTPSSAAAEAFAETAEAVFGLLSDDGRRAAPTLLPAHDVTPYDGLSPHAEISESRGIALGRLADGSASVVVCSAASALLKTPDAGFVKSLSWSLEAGDEFFLEDLEAGLSSVGYQRNEPVEMVGQFSIRGGIVDVFSPESPRPVRLEMLGDQLESIREFDAETQKSVRQLGGVTLLPLSEYSVASLVAEGAEALLRSGWEFSEAVAERRQASLLDLAELPVVAWCDPSAVAQHAAAHAEKLAERAEEGAAPAGRFYWTLEQFRNAAALRRQVVFDPLGLGADHSAEEAAAELRTQKTPRFQGNIAHAVQEMKARLGEGAQALVASSSIGDVERYADIFNEYGVSYQLGVQDRGKLSPYLQERASLGGPTAGAVIAKANIRDGVSFPDAGVLIYGTEDIFAASELVAKPEKRKSAASTFLSDLEDLKPGDLVVHTEHGVGRYLGMTKVEQGSRQEDLMMIEYADRAKLYVPLSRLDLLEKFHGAGGRAPTLDRMGGQSWKKTKSRIKARLVDMADDLLKLYAQRRLANGFAYSLDGEWQRELEDSFKYTPTADQIKAFEDVKNDMESAQAMDRLICGDVGFGKTEVAMRAAFKALGDDKQVALLAPTTVLSFQHFETFRQRFASFPVTVEMLNRFRTPKEQKAIVERVALGEIDVLIGTHRILSKDVEFADLGLMIVDEEQRFGVRHKERLKQIKKNVDVLSMSATPIPRTLHMSLVGLRDISIIQMPPKDRLAIHTVVAPFTGGLVKTAIEREVARGGQVYYIHNRVETIWSVAAHIQELAPGVRIGVGHGQLGEKELENVILKFMNHEYDVLVATTIVENGLDIPLANTMVIDHADHFGLSELYQLRGRVGRSDRRAYAYLLIPEDRELTEVARKRLAALKEFSELGAGFKIAALDLELRGAGNLLGAEQSGHIGAVGFETYCRLLEETVRELRGEQVEEEVRTQLRLQTDIHIPTEYITDETQRLRAYKRLAAISGVEDREALEAELTDRYGPLPEAVRNLMDYSQLKSLAEKLRVASIDRRSSRVSIKFREDSKVDPERLLRAVAMTPGTSFSPTGELLWSNPPESGPKLLDSLRDLLKRIAA